MRPAMILNSIFIHTIPVLMSGFAGLSCLVNLHA